MQSLDAKVRSFMRMKDTLVFPNFGISHEFEGNLGYNAFFF